LFQPLLSVFIVWIKLSNTLPKLSTVIHMFKMSKFVYNHIINHPCRCTR